MTTAISDRLTLADWRRRVAELYADVRRLAADDPATAWEHWRVTRETLFREHPQSPVPASARSAFVASHWPYDARLRFEVVVEVEPEDSTHPARSPLAPAESPAPGGRGAILALPNSGEESLGFSRVGSVTIPFPDRPRTLAMFWLSGYAGGLFLPFRDGTSGHETYAAGRYLVDAAKSADLGGDSGRGTVILDFNFAYQPSCAWDPRWACPLAPPENRLDLRIEAGERLTVTHD
jgi:uncharacterized protein (DUF1684 family)